MSDEVSTEEEHVDLTLYQSVHVPSEPISSQKKKPFKINSYHNINLLLFLLHKVITALNICPAFKWVNVLMVECIVMYRYVMLS